MSEDKQHTLLQPGIFCVMSEDKQHTLLQLRIFCEFISNREDSWLQNVQNVQMIPSAVFINFGCTVVVVVVDDRFYIALFSALKQTQCALVACDSK